MEPTTAGSPESGDTSPGLVTVDTNDSVITNESVTDEKNAQPQNGSANPPFPPPKTDKPRPHVCGTCGRSFARLEHLKRHERSHTKEKPFECPECTRCFARRDLLLRHQQKLHMTGATSSRPRAGRRESVGGTSVSGSGRVRKNSMANSTAAGSAGAQPQSRRNTIAHVDMNSIPFMDPTVAHMNRLHALGLNPTYPVGMGGVAGPAQFDYRGMPNALGHHGLPHGLPKLDMSAANSSDMSDMMHTAPPMGSFAHQIGFDLDSLFSPGTTVNPAQLHSEGPRSSIPPQFAGLDSFNGQQFAAHDGDDFGWMRNWNMRMNPNNEGNDDAIDESSPSRLSSGDTPDDYSEAMAYSQSAIPIPNGDFSWQAPTHPRHSISGDGTFQLDVLGSGLPLIEGMPDTISPDCLQESTPNANVHADHKLSQQQLQKPPPDPMQGAQHQAPHFFAPSLSNFSSDSPSLSSSSMTGSARQSSVTSASTDSITDATRQALLNSLSQPSVFGHSHRKFSQPSIPSPLSPGAARNSTQGPSLPSTADIRRYVEAFIHFAHPHMPVAHIPTLSFDKAEYSSSIRSSTPQAELNQASIQGGGGCLILAMAAMGALYEYDHPASKELFEAAKRMIGLYLEERRKADMSAAVSGSRGGNGNVQNTPVWLVHAMLLNVIYGHQCGDKTSADIASNHCAALVSLARAADLSQPPHRSGSPSNDEAQAGTNGGDVHMVGNSISEDSKQQGRDVDLHGKWLVWKDQEERKRTLFAIFILSSTLVCAFDQPPTMMNSEMLMELPCDEELWSARTAEEWQERGGRERAERNAIPFTDALSYLLTANQRQGPEYASNAYNSNNPLGALQAGDGASSADFKPSTFGCLVLIHALHNYIWETRSRHQGREWTQQETESMFSHIEPALNAWQAAWKANEHHKLERPNPFGLGPLSADSIPLLDLAFVRLFVNLGRAKEAFWRRDFDAMSEELARGDGIVPQGDGSGDGEGGGDARRKSPSRSPEKNSQRRRSQAQVSNQSASRRERHLRKAAFYAADSMTIACSYNLTYTDMTAHELPVQSAMCFFDCSQVLAEWASTVQERVGRYLGVLGRDRIDYSQVPAIMLLESEDIELFRKITGICESLEAKRFQQENLLAMDMQQMSPGVVMNNMQNGVNLASCGYSSRILRVTAMMLEKAVVWPVTHVVAKALETQAVHTDRRAERSVST